MKEKKQPKPSFWNLFPRNEVLNSRAGRSPPPYGLGGLLVSITRTTPTGSAHYLHDLPGRTTSTPSGLPVRHSKDGSFLRMQQTSATRIEIEFPNGLVSVFNKADRTAGTNYCGNGVTGCWRYAETADPYGNKMTVSYAIAGTQETWTVGDSTGRSHQLIFSRSNAVRGGGDCPQGALCTPTNDEWGDLARGLTQVRLAAFANIEAVYNFTTELKTLSRGCTIESEFLPLDDSTITIPILTAIRPPHGQPFTFTTDTTLTTGCNPRAGTIERMTLPTLGAITPSFGCQPPCAGHLALSHLALRRPLP